MMCSDFGDHMIVKLNEMLRCTVCRKESRDFVQCKSVLTSVCFKCYVDLIQFEADVHLGNQDGDRCHFVAKDGKRCEGVSVALGMCLDDLLDYSSIVEDISDDEELPTYDETNPETGVRFYTGYLDENGFPSLEEMSYL